LGFGVWGLAFRVQRLPCGRLAFSVWGLAFGVQGSGFALRAFGVQRLGFGVWGLIKNKSNILNHYSLFLNLRGIFPFRYRYSRNDVKHYRGLQRSFCRHFSFFIFHFSLFIIPFRVLR